MHFSQPPNYRPKGLVFNPPGVGLRRLRHESRRLGSASQGRKKTNTSGFYAKSSAQELMCRRMVWWKIDPDVVTYGMIIGAGERGGLLF